jgi:two-component system, OmpR family, response regulator QseB
MNRSLLIVEDDLDQLDILGGLFTRVGYEVVAVHYPRLALEAASCRSFQVALLDQGLPEMDGLQLMQHLHRLQSGLRVVLLTGQCEPASKELAEDAGGVRLPRQAESVAPDRGCREPRL